MEAKEHIHIGNDGEIYTHVHDDESGHKHNHVHQILKQY